METGRLILRRYVTSDFQDLYEYLSDSEVVKFEPYKPMAQVEVKENLEWYTYLERYLCICQVKRNIERMRDDEI